MDDMSITETRVGVTSLPDVIGQIKQDLGSSLRLREELYGGVSGSRVYRGDLVGAGGSVAEVALKHDKGVGQREGAARALVERFLCLPEDLHYGDDHVLYRFVRGPTVDIAVRTRQIVNGAAPFDDFAQIHAAMWKQTLKEGVPLGGYASKIGETTELVLATTIRDEQGRDIPLRDLAQHELVVNGVSVGSLGSVLANMGGVVSGERWGVVSHGDEGAVNAIIDLRTHTQVMVDHGTAAIRAVGEPLAKVLLWFDATASEDEGYELVRKNGKLILNTSTFLPEYVGEAVSSVRSKLEPWLATPEQRRTAAACMMMYLFRELQWLGRRGRSNMAPHLLAKALSFAPAMEGREAGAFPLEPMGRWGRRREKVTGHRMKFIGNKDELARVTAEMKDQLEGVKLMGFDLDGTLVGENITFPKAGLLAVRRLGINTAVISGAGFASIVNKVERGIGRELGSLAEVFSGPVVANEGAQIFSSQTNTKEPGVDDILAETPLGDEELDGIASFAKEQAGKVGLFGFYPTTARWEASGKYNPFEYVVYTRDAMERDRLQGRYGNFSVTGDIEEFVRILRAAGASKFVIKAPIGVVESLREGLSRIGLSGVINEGYINVVSGKVNKFTAEQQVLSLSGYGEEIRGEEIMHFGNDFNDLEALNRCGIGVIVRSNPDIADKLVEDLSKNKVKGYTLVVEPDLLDDLLIEIARMKSGG